MCPYCNKKAELVGGEEVYPHRPDLFALKYWLCRPCEAYVGTHSNSDRNIPYGRLANKELRELRGKVHAVFDPIWRKYAKENGVRPVAARNLCYAMLASKLGIKKKQCHVGRFDEQMCLRAIEICQPQA